MLTLSPLLLSLAGACTRLPLAANYPRLPLANTRIRALPCTMSDFDDIKLSADVPDSEPLMALIDDALPLETADRQQLVERTVRAWAAADRKDLSKKMSDLLSQRAVAIQSDALERFNKGEDVTKASETLQTIVDMTVQVQLLVRTLSLPSLD